MSLRTPHRRFGPGAFPCICRWCKAPFDGRTPNANHCKSEACERARDRDRKRERALAKALKTK